MVETAAFDGAAWPSVAAGGQESTTLFAADNERLETIGIGDETNMDGGIEPPYGNGDCGTFITAADVNPSWLR